MCVCVCVCDNKLLFPAYRAVLVLRFSLITFDTMFNLRYVFPAMQLPYYRAMLGKRGLCCHAVYVRLSVCHVRGSRQTEFFEIFFAIG